MAYATPADEYLMLKGSCRNGWLTTRSFTLSLTTNFIFSMPLFLYLDHQSFVHRRHPLVKVGGLFFFFISAFVVDHPLFVLPVSLGILTLILWSKATANLYRLRILFFFIFLFTLADLECLFSAWDAARQFSLSSGDTGGNALWPWHVAENQHLPRHRRALFVHHAD